MAKRPFFRVLNVNYPNILSKNISETTLQQSWQFFQDLFKCFRLAVGESVSSSPCSGGTGGGGGGGVSGESSCGSPVSGSGVPGSSTEHTPPVASTTTSITGHAGLLDINTATALHLPSSWSLLADTPTGNDKRNHQVTRRHKGSFTRDYHEKYSFVVIYSKTKNQ